MFVVRCNLDKNLVVMVFALIFLTTLALTINPAFAMGQAPSTCPNRYDGPITSATITVGDQTYDPIANPGLTFVLENDKSYIVTFTIHTQAQSSQGNSDPGTTWYRTTVLGYANGACVDGAGPNQDITKTSSYGHPSNMAPEGTQRVDFGTFVSGFYYHVLWLKPGNNNPTPPFPPTKLSANAVSSSQIDLIWTAPTDDGGSPITEYIIYRFHDCNSTSLCYYTAHTNSIATIFSDNGLEPNTTYYYRVYAVNQVGTSYPSNTESATTFSAPQPQITTSQLTVNSQDNNGSPITGFFTELSQNGNQISADFTPASFTLNNGESYTVQVEDFGNYMFDHWSDTSSTDATRDISITSDTQITAVYKTIPQPPTGLEATAISSSQIDLSWTAPSDDGGSLVTGYMIGRSADDGSTWDIIVDDTGNTDTTYSDTGLSPNTTYTYRVSSINSVGKSDPSDTAYATTPLLSAAGIIVGPGPIPISILPLP